MEGKDFYATVQSKDAVRLIFIQLVNLHASSLVRKEWKGVDCRLNIAYILTYCATLTCLQVVNSSGRSVHPKHFGVSSLAALIIIA